MVLQDNGERFTGPKNTNSLTMCQQVGQNSWSNCYGTISTAQHRKCLRIVLEKWKTVFHFSSTMQRRRAVHCATQRGAHTRRWRRNLVRLASELQWRAGFAQHAVVDGAVYPMRQNSLHQRHKLCFE